MILEGVYLGSAHGATLRRTILDDLSLFTTMKVGGLVPIPAFNIYFFRGVWRLFSWDYSFFENLEIVRYFWMVILTPGAVWGIGSVFAPVFANLLRIFR